MSTARKPLHHRSGRGGPDAQAHMIAFDEADLSLTASDEDSVWFAANIRV